MASGIVRAGFAEVVLAEEYDLYSSGLILSLFIVVEMDTVICKGINFHK